MIKEYGNKIRLELVSKGSATDILELSDNELTWDWKRSLKNGKDTFPLSDLSSDFKETNKRPKEFVKIASRGLALMLAGVIALTVSNYLGAIVKCCV